MDLFIAGADFACVLVLAIVVAATFFSHKRKERKFTYFLISSISLLVFSTIDSIAFVMDVYGGNETALFYMNLLSFVGIDFFVPSFIYFVSEKIKEKGNFSSIHARIALGLSIFDFTFIIAGAYSGQLFTIENGSSVEGPLYRYVGFIPLAVNVYFLVQLVLSAKKVGNRVAFSIASYFLFPLVMTVLELINPTLQFAYVSISLASLLVYVLVVREDLQSTVLSERQIRNESVTDSLTGLYNRKAYSEDTELLGKKYHNDFVYISLDLNGLKKANDEIGHAAGDEIIQGAAQCMSRCFGLYGKVYRTGGDEFTAIIYASKSELTKILALFDKELSDWRGKISPTLSMSYGYVTGKEIQGISIHDVSVLADQRMYAAKAAYYREKGIDRRGQHEAHTALCSLYTKIIRINLTDDSYQIISMDPNEQAAQKGFSSKISRWFYGFGMSGQVYPDDLNEYLDKTNFNYIGDYFREGKTSLSIYYRRKFGDEYKQAVMEMIPTEEYTENNKTLFLYVKMIDK